ncbi:hypothetical protein BJ138DRAFT_1182080 [Hygrophoropsis aurantiaca]|uniref:Uncharacterized protein n=1 Tax=Hygrophoropsis aurantiaca TaxID=72124 RepID=A0ACB8A3I1_9AGAM|nr:hypothetical protein BJ138DRAFT_1182080 [Hygrophoropsis aurantiaca]
MNTTARAVRTHLQLVQTCPARSARTYSALKFATKPTDTQSPSLAPSKSEASTILTSTQSTASESSFLHKLRFSWPKAKKAGRKKAKEKKVKAATQSKVDAQLQQIEQMMKLPHMYPTLDMWSSKLETLDVEIPRNIEAMRTSTPRPSLRQYWDAVIHNFNNWAKNTYSMYQIASANAFPPPDAIHSPSSFPFLPPEPPLDFPHTLGIRHFFSPRVWRHLGNLQNNASNALLAPLRRTAMNLYLEMGRAIADKDMTAIRAVTTGDQTTKLLKLVRTRDPSLIYKWQAHGHVAEGKLGMEKALFAKDQTAPSPATIISIRAAEVYHAKEDPKHGHRLAIHALVKFETMQSLGVLSKTAGRNITTPEPQRVVEYMVLEKVGWYNKPWTVREQIYE